jgi:mono/diheme cytochrome c family protein
MSIKPTYMTRPFRWIAFSLAILFSTPAIFAQDASDEISTDAAVIAAGEALFTANCKQCHQVHKKVIGPALAGVTERREVSWLLPWIKNSQKVIASGDEYAVALYEEYGKAQMQSFTLSDSEILSILAYVKNETANPPVEEQAVAVSGADGNTGGGAQADSGYLTAVMVVLVVVLVLILIVLGLIVSVLTKYLKEQKELDTADSEVVNQQIDMMAFFKSNAFLGMVVFIFTALVLKTVIDGAFTIGVQQGYQPTQPIAFSHQLHAGQYEIDCNYCHTGVRKGRSANIPSPNICMNCHTVIKNVGGQPGVSSEISKIYAAIDYDPETNEYGTDTRPIEWVRIHNLPDLAYFNHSQHVAVAGLECQTCHGEIQEMEVVYQYANLTMGWCINCHRETDVNTRGNAYYDNLVKLHGETSREPMKVEDIGGLECSKCHY